MIGVAITQLATRLQLRKFATNIELQKAVEQVYFHGNVVNSVVFFAVISDLLSGELSKIAITQLAIELQLSQIGHYTEHQKVGEQHVLQKCSKFNSFAVTIDLLKT